MPIRLSFICHARTEAQRLGRFALDEPADPKGLLQAQEMAAALKKPVRILCAPETRTLQTAQALGDDIEIVPALEDTTSASGEACAWSTCSKVFPRYSPTGPTTPGRRPMLASR